MPRLEIVPFSDRHVAEAGALLAARHRRHRLAEPLLPPRFEEPSAAVDELATAWRRERASGTAALRDGRLVGYLVGAPRDDSWGPNVWVELAGHAVEEAEDVRDLYAAAAAQWVEEGRTRHYVLAPASDDRRVDAWFRLGFGAQHAHGIRELGDEPAPPASAAVRQAEPRDVDELVSLAPLVAEHQELSPVFSAWRSQQDEDELRVEIETDLASDTIGNLVAELDGRIVGNFVVVPVELSSTHVGLARPDGASHLGWAATASDVRGSGAGMALTHAAFAWARSRGYDVMVTDWRETNLLSSRFWPRRGFRTSFLRLYRSIP